MDIEKLLRNMLLIEEMGDKLKNILQSLSEANPV